MGVSKALTQISTYNLAAFFTNIKDVQLTEQAIKIPISSATREKNYIIYILSYECFQDLNAKI
jgi:hypothetical protein